MLCIAAQIIPIPIKENALSLSLITRQSTTVLSIPPERLITEAVKPLVIRAKTPFITVIEIAPGKPIVEATSIVTTLESPGFAPTGRKGISGISILSRKESTRLSAAIIPRKAVLLVFKKSPQ
jgi:hypothetical protein